MQKSKIKSCHANLHKVPSKQSGLEMQVLHGHEVKLLGQKNGWAKIKTECGYQGYIEKKHLGKIGQEPTHMVKIPNTFAYKKPNIKSEVKNCLSMGSKVRAKNIAKNFAQLEDGTYIYGKHLLKLGESQDCLKTCEMLLGTPYRWGGNTGEAVDCSGLIYLANMLAGKVVPRNSGEQQKLGKSINIKLTSESLQKGDYIFWKGHVGIMKSKTMLIHASGKQMQVVKEPLAKQARPLVARTLWS